MSNTHEHQWQPQGTTTHFRESCSPCSRADDHLWEEIIAIQACGCGAMRYLAIGFKNQRRRGDDWRRAKGLEPLGRPLRRSGTYKQPEIKQIVEPK